MSMELDDMKQAWQQMDQRLTEQASLYRQLHRAQGIDRLRRGLRPLVWGQSLQMGFGVATMLWGISFWTTHPGVWHQLLCGIAVQIFGTLMVAFAAWLLFHLQGIDHAAPVLDIQRRLAQLRSWRVRVEAPLFAVLGSVIWVPMMLMLIQYDFDQWHDDYWNHAPGLVGHMVFSGVASLILVLIVYALLRKAGHRRWMENNFAGATVCKAETMLAQISRFEQE
jgi:hypothetical protein